jgi:hypothetical protein
MDSNALRSLEKLAQERLRATESDDEPYSFLFRTDGAIGLSYCPWWVVEEFGGEIEGLDLAWSKERIESIEAGADLTEEELQQWREAQGHRLAKASDWATAAWIVPLWLEGRAAAYALFLCEGEADEEPRLAGIYETIEAGRAGLVAEGVVARD